MRYKLAHSAWQKIGPLTIDIVQPPRIGISPIVDMDARPAVVSAALAATSF